MNKFAVATIVVALTVGTIVACTPHAQVKPEAPLKTSGAASPTQQCQDLRAKGGSC
jgi:hypothetical protein